MKRGVRMKKERGKIFNNDKYYVSLSIEIALYNIMAFLLLCGFIYVITITARDRPENIRIVRAMVGMSLAFGGASIFVGWTLRYTIDGILEIRNYKKRRSNRCKKEI